YLFVVEVIGADGHLNVPLHGAIPPAQGEAPFVLSLLAAAPPHNLRVVEDHLESRIILFQVASGYINRDHPDGFTNLRRRQPDTVTDRDQSLDQIARDSAGIVVQAADFTRPRPEYRVALRGIDLHDVTYGHSCSILPAHCGNDTRGGCGVRGLGFWVPGRGF